MDIINQLKVILAELLDMNPHMINKESYLIRDLDVESIDLLELGIEISDIYNISVDDDLIFLKKLRLYVAENKNKEKIIAEKYPFLSKIRIKEIIKDIKKGPVLKVQDLADYIKWQLNN